MADERTTFESAGGAFDVAVGQSGARYEVYGATLNNTSVGVVIVALDTNGDYRIDTSNSSTKHSVLMQYFGYLRRNPNDLPDSNFNGYDFWLVKLNQFNGNFVEAETVKAFLTSGEYKRRFGP